MAKLHFYYSAMNAGKSTILLQSAYNYKERGMDTILFTPNFDDRYSVGKIASRIGLNADAVAFDRNFNLFNYAEKSIAKNSKIQCVLIDEAQFISKDQVWQLSDITDKLNTPVLAYGLRTDFLGEPFEGSKYLLGIADNLIEIKTICHCGKKATMVLRLDEKGNVAKSGAQIVIGGNDSYISVCRKHFKEQKTK